MRVSVPLSGGTPESRTLRALVVNGWRRLTVLLLFFLKNPPRVCTERHDAKTVSQIKQFTSKLKRLQDEQSSLRMHTDIAGDIMVTAKDEGFLSCLETEQVRQMRPPFIAA